MKQQEKQNGMYERESCARSIASSTTSLDKDYESVSEFSSVSTSYKIYRNQQGGCDQEVGEG